jgi:hypothetical protein
VKSPSNLPGTRVGLSRPRRWAEDHVAGEQGRIFRAMMGMARIVLDTGISVIAAPVDSTGEATRSP